MLLGSCAGCINPGALPLVCATLRVSVRTPQELSPVLEMAKVQYGDTRGLHLLSPCHPPLQLSYSGRWAVQWQCHGKAALGRSRVHIPTRPVTMSQQLDATRDISTPASALI